MVARLKLQPAPTFKATVSIPVPGGKDEPVEFTFKFRNRDEMRKFAESVHDLDEVDIILSIAENWNLIEAFTRENVQTLTDNYVGVGAVIFNVYFEQHTGARAKN